MIYRNITSHKNNQNMIFDSHHQTVNSMHIAINDSPKWKALMVMWCLTIYRMMCLTSSRAKYSLRYQSIIEWAESSTIDICWGVFLVASSWLWCYSKPHPNKYLQITMILLLAYSIRPNKKINVFPEILGRVGTHILFSFFFRKKIIILCILKGILPFKMHKIMF